MSPFVFWPLGSLVGKRFGRRRRFYRRYINRLFSRPLRHFAPLSRYFNHDCRFSINIRIMGRPNLSLLGEDTIFSVANVGGFSEIIFKPLLLAVLVFLLAVFLTRFLLSETGLAMRATGINVRMVRAQGGNPDFYFYFGLGLSNALVALGGALFSQSARFADVTTGVGTIIFGWPPSFWVKHYCAEAPFGWFYWPVCWALFYTVWLSPLRSAWGYLACKRPI